MIHLRNISDQKGKKRLKREKAAFGIFHLIRKARTAQYLVLTIVSLRGKASFICLLNVCAGAHARLFKKPEAGLKAQGRGQHAASLDFLRTNWATARHHKIASVRA